MIGASTNYYIVLASLLGLISGCREVKPESTWTSDWVVYTPNLPETIEWADFQKDLTKYSAVDVWSCRYTSEFITASIPLKTEDLENVPTSLVTQVKWQVSADFCYGTLVKRGNGWLLILKMNRWFYRSCNVDSYCPALVDSTGLELVQLPKPTGVFDLDNQSFRHDMPSGSDFRKTSHLRAAMAKEEIKRVRQELKGGRITQAEANTALAKLSGYLGTSN